MSEQTITVRVLPTPERCVWARFKGDPKGYLRTVCGRLVYKDYVGFEEICSRCGGKIKVETEER